MRKEAMNFVSGVCLAGLACAVLCCVLMMKARDEPYPHPDPPREPNSEQVGNGEDEGEESALSK